MKNTKLKKLSIVLVALALCFTTLAGMLTYSSAAVNPATFANDYSAYRFKQVEGGVDFHLGLTYSGDVYYWGSNQNLSLAEYTRPTKVTELSNIVKIATTSNSAAAVSDSSKLYTWGSNVYGELGRSTGSDTVHRVPVEVTASGVGNQMYNAIVDIAAGENHYVLIGRLSGGDQSAYGWGDNRYRQIKSTASGDLDFSEGVLQATGVILGHDSDGAIVSNAKAVFAGGNTTAILNNNNILYMQGRNYALAGQPIADANESVLGLGSMSHGSNNYVQLPTATSTTISTAATNGFADQTSAQQYTNSPSATSAFFNSRTQSVSITLNRKIVLGNGFGYALSSGNKDIYGWGLNANKQLTSSQSSAIVDTPSTFKTSHSSVITQIAAGKYVTNNLITTINATVDNGTHMIDSDAHYVFASAFLDELNNVYVWTNIQQFPTLVLSKLVGVTIDNPIVSISAGYNGILYLLTRYGKLYIFDGKDMDAQVRAVNDFSDDGSTSVSSFETQKRTITFGNSSDNGGRSADTARVYLSQQTSSNGDQYIHFYNGATLGKTETKNTLDQNQPLVTNRFGDPMIFLENNVQYSGIAAYSSGTTATGKYTFVRDGHDITDKIDSGIQRISSSSNLGEGVYLTYQIVGFGESSYIEIKPLQSTKDRAITLTFLVASYPSTTLTKPQALGTLNGTSYSNTALFDVCSVSIDIIIEDSALPEAKDIVSTPIPWLDANDPTNNVYSATIHDVSSGFDIISKIATDASATITFENGETSFDAYAASKDAGFPLASKGSYLRTQQEYDYGSYTGRYLYFVNDPDAYRATFMATHFSGNDLSDAYYLQNAARDFVVRKSVITMTLDFDASIETEIQKYNFAYNSADGNNIYGLYNISLTNSGTRLTFSYDILRIEAIRTTSSYIAVANNLVETNTKSEKSFNIEFTRNRNDASSIVPNGRTKGNQYEQNAIPIHVLSTLRTNSAHGDVIGNADASGAPNIFEVVISASSNVGDTITLNLSDYIYDTTNIFFTYKTTINQAIAYTLPECFAIYNASFSAGTYTVNANATSIRVKFLDAGTYTVPIFVRRLSNGGPITFGGVENEIIHFVFRLTAIRVTANEMQFKFNGLQEISGPTKFYAKDLFTYYGDGSALKFDSVRSSNPAVMSIQTGTDAGGDFFIATPIATGTATAILSLRQFNTTRTYGFVLNVFGVVSNDEERITETGSLDIDVLKTSLATALGEIGNIDGFVLVKSGTLVQQQLGQAGWVTIDGWDDTEQAVKVENALIINSVHFNSDLTKIDVTVNSVTSNFSDTQERVRFAFQLNEDKIYYIAVRIVPGRVVLVDEHNEKLVIDYKTKTPIEQQDNDKIFTLGNSMIIPIRYILKRIGITSGVEYTSSMIIQVNSRGDKFYCEHDSDQITIVGRYNGVQSINVALAIGNDRRSQNVTFAVNIQEIKLTLQRSEYIFIFTLTAIIVFVVLFVIFMIRMGIYFRKRKQQKGIIEKNKLLIKMRDKMHAKPESSSKEQILKTKLKMEDPKYAKMFNDMRREKEAETGITLDNSVVANKANTKAVAAENAKKKKNKKSLEELKAELQAKREMFGQMGDMQMDEIPIGEGPIISTPGYNAQNVVDDTEFSFDLDEGVNS